MRNGKHDDIFRASVDDRVERDAANTANIRHAAENMKNHHRFHMAKRSEKTLRDAGAAQNYLSAHGEGRHADKAADMHRAAMHNMARTAGQDQHAMDQRPKRQGKSMNTSIADIEARSAVRESERDALTKSAKEKLKAAKEKMEEIMHNR